MIQLADDFTLVIPTYNRPDRLAKLLNFLAHEKLTSRVLVCDSSQHENVEHNRLTVDQAKTALEIEYIAFDPSTPVWTKFTKGVHHVRTPYAALCADDDLVIPEALVEIVDRLKTDPEVALGHGWYFSFYESNHFDVANIVYRGPSLNDRDPVMRMYGLAKRYEALTYGIHRTSTMRDAFTRIASLDSMLTKEVGSGMLVAICGRVERYPILFYGRSLAPSANSSNWHPLEILAERPEHLFKTYVGYRQLLSKALAEIAQISMIDAQDIVDLVHLRYLSDYLTPSVFDCLIEQHLAYTTKAWTMERIWATQAEDAAAARQREAKVSSWVAHAKAMISFPALQDRKTKGMTRRAQTVTGKSREYVVQVDFLRSVKELGDPRCITGSLIEHLNNYAA